MELSCLERQAFDSKAFKLDFYRVVRFDYPALELDLAGLPDGFMADAKLPAQDIDGAKALIRLGFRKACVQPTYVRDLAGEPASSGGAERGPDTLAGMEADELDAHAGNFPFSRFGLDPGLTREQCVSHQRAWILNSLATPGVYKFVEPGAFLSFKLRDDAAVIDLVSVLPPARGRGSVLFGRLASWARASGLARIEVTTESENLRACLFYQKNACRLDRAAVAFHLRGGAST